MLAAPAQASEFRARRSVVRHPAGSAIDRGDVVSLGRMDDHRALARRFGVDFQ